MRTCSFLVPLLLAVAACGGSQKTSPQAKAGAECAAAAQNTGRLLAAAAPEAPPAMLTEVSGVIERRCVADAWSPEARGCIAKAADQAGMDVCDPLLTQAQKDAAGKEISEVLTRTMGGMGYGGSGYGGSGYGTP